MRNLFVCHTQAQLILATGLCLGRFKDADNHLILFQDFLLNNNLKDRLDRVFTKTLYLQGIFPQQLNTFKEKLKNYPVNDRKMKEFMTKPYDKVFTVCDTIYPEQKCMSIAHKINNKTEYCWLEDGALAYYLSINIRKGLGSNQWLRLVRKIYFKYIKQLGQFYDRDFIGFGGTRCIKNIYCIYPEAVREPYKSRRSRINIQDREYLSGLTALYAPCLLPIKEGDVILLMDKLQTYIHPEKVKVSVKKIIKESLAAGKRVFCKFHPRETENWNIFDGCETLDKSVGAESMYLSLADKSSKITVVGIKSAGIMSAKKLGFRTLSLFLSCGEQNPELVKFFDVIGIEMI